jgi:hypothetical protein
MSVSSAIITGVTFTSTVCLKDEGPFSTFKEALANFINRMKTEPGARSVQLTETACWIQRNSNGTQIPLGFYDVRDFGFAMGMLGEGAVPNPEAAEPDPVLVADLYSVALNIGTAQRFIEHLKTSVSQAAHA